MDNDLNKPNSKDYKPSRINKFNSFSDEFAFITSPKKEFQSKIFSDNMMLKNSPNSCKFRFIENQTSIKYLINKIKNILFLLNIKNDNNKENESKLQKLLKKTNFDFFKQIQDFQDEIQLVNDIHKQLKQKIPENYLSSITEPRLNEIIDNSENRKNTYKILLSNCLKYILEIKTKISKETNKQGIKKIPKIKLIIENNIFLNFTPIVSTKIIKQSRNKPHILNESENKTIENENIQLKYSINHIESLNNRAKIINRNENNTLNSRNKNQGREGESRINLKDNKFLNKLNCYRSKNKEISLIEKRNNLITLNSTKDNIKYNELDQSSFSKEVNFQNQLQTNLTLSDEKSKKMNYFQKISKIPKLNLSEIQESQVKESKKSKSMSHNYFEMKRTNEKRVSQKSENLSELLIAEENDKILLKDGMFSYPELTKEVRHLIPKSNLFFNEPSHIKYNSNERKLITNDSIKTIDNNYLNTEYYHSRNFSGYSHNTIYNSHEPYYFDQAKKNLNNIFQESNLESNRLRYRTNLTEKNKQKNGYRGENVNQNITHPKCEFL